MNRSSVMSRTFSCSHRGGWPSDLLYSWPVSGIFVPSVLDVLPRQFPVSLKRRIDVRFRVKHHPIQEISTLFAVLEQHQRRYAHNRNDVLQHHVHGQTEHLPIKESPEDIHHDGHCQDREHILCFEPGESYPRPEISVDWRNVQSHDLLLLLSHPGGAVAHKELCQPQQPRHHQAESSRKEMPHPTACRMDVREHSDPQCS